jgi:hypothetical protein
MLRNSDVFLGLVDYYRKFVKHFAIISQPLTKLLKKGTTFVWTQLQEKAFDTLKQTLVTTPVLSYQILQRLLC